MHLFFYSYKLTEEPQQKKNSEKTEMFFFNKSGKSSRRAS
jgi:hypothetical protein